LISILLDGVSGIADYQCRKLLHENYLRLAPVFSPGVTIEMDAVDRIPQMLEFANNVDLTDTIKWIRRYWLQFAEQ